MKILKRILIVFSIVMIQLLPTVMAAEQAKLRVLVIEQNPYLKTKGNITATQYLNQEKDVSLCVEELIEDVEYGSNGNVDVEIVGWERFNEFVTSKNLLTLSNGTSSHTLDEATWLETTKNGWYGIWSSDIVKELGSYSYDYEYLLRKTNLVNRKNNDEFDQVWLVNVDPVSTYESMMVGRTAYWVNGLPIKADCDNFVILNVSISRRDANNECIGHMIEAIIRDVFGESYNSYGKNTITIDDYSDVEKLNLWERFILNSYSTGDYSSVGNIHFAPNGEYDYDWMNEKYVESSWIDWKENYPNLTGETVLTNYRTWVPKGKENWSGRYHHRWWFSLMPHIDGKTEDGYSNNWWDYIVSLEHVDSIVSMENELKMNKGRSSSWSNIQANL